MPEPVEPPPPVPEPEPEGPFVPPRLGDWTVRDVERLLDEQGEAFPDRAEELARLPRLVPRRRRARRATPGRSRGRDGGRLPRPDRARRSLLAHSEEPEGDPGHLVARPPLPSRPRTSRPSPTGSASSRNGRPAAVRAASARATASRARSTTGRSSGRLDPGEQLRELVGAEGLLAWRAGLDDCGRRRGGARSRRRDRRRSDPRRGACATGAGRGRSRPRSRARPRPRAPVCRRRRACRASETRTGRPLVACRSRCSASTLRNRLPVQMKTTWKTSSGRAHRTCPSS